MRNRTFLANGAKFIDPAFVINNNWEKPELRCTTLTCATPRGKLTPIDSVTTDLDVICVGKKFDLTLIKIKIKIIYVSSNSEYWPLRSI